MIEKPQGHPKRRRLTYRREFCVTQDEGNRFFTKNLIFLYRPNDLGHPRLGITVTKKVGNAVVRNRIKRVVREAFRRIRPLENVGVDLVVIPKKAMRIPPAYSDVAEDFKHFNHGAH